MDDITKTKYAGWLEEFITDIMLYQPERFGVCMLLPEGGTYTNYFGDCGHMDKGSMGYTMTLDAIMEVTTANAKDIMDAAEEEEGEDS